MEDGARASMGPSMSIDGVIAGHSMAATAKARFNGAVDEHRRSRPGAGRQGHHVPHASMGPSMSIDGVIGGQHTEVSAEVIASMGPSMSIDGVRRAGIVRLAMRCRFNGAVDEHRRSHAENSLSSVTDV